MMIPYRASTNYIQLTQSNRHNTLQVRFTTRSQVQAVREVKQSSTVQHKTPVNNINRHRRTEPPWTIPVSLSMAFGESSGRTVQTFTVNI